MWWIGVGVFGCAPDERQARVDIYEEPLSVDLDADQDGILNRDERRIDTDPNEADTDGDGLDDGEELLEGLDPLSPDTDGDGLLDDEELEIGTDPTLPDSDRGGRWDGEELLSDRDPLDPGDDGRPTLVGDYSGGGGCTSGRSPAGVAPVVLLVALLSVRQRGAP